MPRETSIRHTVLVVSRGEVYGVLVDCFDAPHDFAPKEVELLSRLADHAALAVEHARLYAEAQSREMEARRVSTGLALLHQASRALHRTLDVEAMLSSAVDVLTRAFGAAAALVVTLDEGGAVSRRTGRWLSPEHERDAAASGRDGVTERVRDTRVRVLLRDLREHADTVAPGQVAHGVRRRPSPWSWASASSGGSAPPVARA